MPPDFTDPRLPKGRFSHSQYSKYKNCARAYEFRYVQGLRGAAHGMMFKGLRIHQGAEFALNAKIRDRAFVLTDPADIQRHAVSALREAEALVADAFDEKKDEVTDWGEDATAGRAKDSTLQAYQAFHLGAVPKADPIAVEKAFATWVGNVPMIGYIDLIDRVKMFDDKDDPGVEVVADLKYSGASWSQADIDKDPQFTLYALVEKNAAVRVDNLVSLKKGPVFKQLTSVRTDHDKRILTEDIEETVDLIGRGIFPKTSIDSWACSERWCDYWGQCRGKKT
jgi:hypothetical protein